MVFSKQSSVPYENLKVAIYERGLWAEVTTFQEPEDVTPVELQGLSCGLRHQFNTVSNPQRTKHLMKSSHAYS